MFCREDSESKAGPFSEHLALRLGCLLNGYKYLNYSF
ncbi:MAG: hypothetical protein QG625_143 [Cyanobacteriota bacterium erpe_2018_sw_39hr_WHONDRS-SW48-000098_B_bin.30]|nr:hypothetical protein [Cyanobacteriota bacterium erpe_2018_sw_39hr_WHONDRS-SW48-000098_B_bin.30]